MFVLLFVEVFEFFFGDKPKVVVVVVSVAEAEARDFFACVVIYVVAEGALLKLEASFLDLLPWEMDGFDKLAPLVHLDDILCDTLLVIFLRRIIAEVSHAVHSGEWEVLGEGVFKFDAVGVSCKDPCLAEGALERAHA